MATQKFTPIKTHGSCVYLHGSAGGFDVRECPNADELAKFIACACNAHEQLVTALQYAKHRLELADEDRFDKTTLQQINDALKAAGAAPHD